MVQNTSRFPEDFNGITFRYEFLLRTTLEITFHLLFGMWKMANFQIFRMSSLVEVLITGVSCGQKWKVWVLRKCFAPFLMILGPLNHIFKKVEFLTFLNFWIVGFWTSGPKFFHNRPDIGRSIIFPWNIPLELLVIQNVVVRMYFLVL